MQFLFHLNIHGYPVLVIPWNIFLAIVPCLIAYHLEKSVGKRKWADLKGHKFAFILIFLFWLFILPNTAYLIFDVRHLVDYCDNLDMYRVCLNRLGRDYELSAAAELIPDHIPLDVKRRFSTEYPDTLLKIAPELAPLERDAFLEALRKSLSEYVAEDPLKVFRLALIEICRTTQADAALASDLAAIVTHIAE